MRPAEEVEVGMSVDAFSMPSSLTVRRQAASNLPNFELPPLNNLQFAPTMVAVGSTGGLPITTSTSQSAQQPAQKDRPFRCDSCPQSFNRNHDLKRHKRVHPAVKPFPCKHCGKGYFRRDALQVSSNMIQQISIV
jgi:uncharacterized Zn-finger protein